MPLHPGINAAVQAGLQPSLPGPLRENTQNKGKSGKGAGVSRPCTFRHCGQTPLPGRRPWRTRTRGSGSWRGGEGRGPASGQPPPLSPALQRAGSGAPEAEEERGGGVRPLPGPWQRVAMQPRQLRWETLAALRTSSKGQLSYCRHWLQDEVRVRSRRAAGSPWACASWGRLRGEIGDSPLRALAER